MPSSLSPAAKTKIAALFAVVVAGITAWQGVTRDGFTWLDVIPVIGVVTGAIAAKLIPNTPGQPVAKAIVHGALSAVSAAAAVVSAYVASDPTGVTAVKLLFIGAGAVLVWYVPELAPDVKVIEGEVAPELPTPPVTVVPDEHPATDVAAPALDDTQEFPAVVAVPPVAASAPQPPAAEPSASMGPDAAAQPAVAPTPTA